MSACLDEIRKLIYLKVLTHILNAITMRYCKHMLLYFVRENFF